MPGITINQYDVANRDVNKQGDDERVARLKYIDQRWSYYDGTHRRPLKIEPGQADDNVILNVSGRAMDKSVEFIGVPRRFELPGAGNKEPDAAGQLVEVISAEQEALDLLYKAYRHMLPEILLSGLVSGHNFLKLYIENDRAAMTLLDPRYVTVYWDGLNMQRVLFYRQQWQAGTVTYRQDIVPNWLILGGERPTTTDTDNGDGTQTIVEGWKIIDYRQDKRASARWEQTALDDWDFPFPPIVEWSNKRRPHQHYGVSDLSHAELNDSINFIASNTARIIKYHAHPRTIAAGVEAEDVNTTSVDGLFTVPKESNIFNLEMQGDLSSSMAMLQKLESAFFSGARVIDTSTISDKLGQITNFGVRMMFSDQIEATQDKRDRYGLGVAEAFRRMMVIDGMDIPEAPNAVWDDPIPVNRIELVAAATQEKALGTTSLQTLAQDLGRDYAAEQERKAEEGNNAGEQFANILERTAQRGLF